MNIRVIWNVILCKIGVRQVLPRDFIRTRSEQENNDPLVDIYGDKNLLYKDNIQRPVLFRSHAFELLKKAAANLPQGLHIKVYDAYRPIARQRQQWERRIIETREEFPNLPEPEIVRLTRLKVAEPNEGFGGHQTGGAIDITLCTASGEELDMGEKISTHNKKTPTINKYISKEHIENRLILKSAMENAGFKNFPAEWWHYSFGDKMWAAYSNKPTAIYGYIEPKMMKKAKLNEGLESIAECMEVNPEDVFFMHSTNLDPKNEINRRERYVGFINLFHNAQIIGYIPRTQQDKTAKGIILYLNQDLAKYLNDCGLAPFGNYINLNHFPTEIKYPDVSVATILLNKIKDKSINIDLKNKVLVSSYLSEVEEEIQKETGCKLIMKPYDQIQFNSKIRLRQRASIGGYFVPPGVEILNANSFDEEILKLKKIVSDLNLTETDVKFWVKADSQGSGKGLINVLGLGDDIINSIKEHIIETATKLNLYEDDVMDKNFNNISYFMPFAIEIDLNSLTNLEYVANMCVKGFVGNDVSLFGSAIQIVKNGHYIGSEVSPESEKYEKLAEQFSSPVFHDFSKEGYRGYLAVDVLIFKNKKDNNYLGYCIDPNARFSGGTVLLSILHYSESKTGKKLYGISYFNEVRDNGNIFDSVKLLAGDDLYLGEKSNYLGIVPVLINDITTIPLDNIIKRVVQVIVIDKTIEKVWERYNRYKANIKEDIKKNHIDPMTNGFDEIEYEV